MAKLTLLLKGETTEWELGPFLLTIGRRPDNNLVFDDRFVSSHHAVVSFAQGRHYIEDLKSSNGTLLNGAPVQRAALTHGDAIRIGTHTLQFHDEPVATPAIPLPGAQPVSVIDPSATAEAAMLDELVGSIRSHREREQRERDEVTARVREEWDKLLALAEQIKAKISGDPRVRYFGIDRRANDVMIRIQRSPQSPQQVITIALQHPDYRGDHALKGIWLIRTGENGRCLPTAQAIATELIRDLAFVLA